MGYSISWVGLNMPRSTALEMMGFRDTGLADEANEAPYSIASLPSGWSIIWANDFDYASHADTLRRSSETLMIGCQVEEHVMFSACHAAQNGRMMWKAWHDAQRDIYDIQTSGAVPAEFAALVAAQRREQDADGGADGEVDHLFDAPIHLAAALTGYRHDHDDAEGGEPQFTAIERPR